MDRIDKKMDSKFRFVLVAAQRAEQLMRGGRPRVDLKTTKLARLAMEEVMDEKVVWDYGPPPEPEVADEPLVAEAEAAEPADGEAAGDVN